MAKKALDRAIAVLRYCAVVSYPPTIYQVTARELVVDGTTPWGKGKSGFGGNDGILMSGVNPRSQLDKRLKGENNSITWIPYSSLLGHAAVLAGGRYGSGARTLPRPGIDRVHPQTSTGTRSQALLPLGRLSAGCPRAATHPCAILR